MGFHKMSGAFYLAATRHLATDAYARLLVTSGVNQNDMDLFRGDAAWHGSDRLRVRRVFDTVLYAMCDMSGLPRVEIPAEMPAAIIAMVVSPTNWMTCASWLSGLKPARDLMESEETVQIETFSSARMMSLILFADAAMRDASDYAVMSKAINDRLAVRIPPGEVL